MWPCPSSADKAVYGLLPYPTAAAAPTFSQLPAYSAGPVADGREYDSEIIAPLWGLPARAAARQPHGTRQRGACSGLEASQNLY